MRVFSQINNCQQKQNKKTKQKQKTDKTKRGAPLLGLAKSIYYSWTGFLSSTIHDQCHPGLPYHKPCATLL